jgi:hypothetical protein
MDSLDIGAMIQPLPKHGIYRDEGFYCWGPNVIKGDDGRYYMAYSRWPEHTQSRGWLTDSEIALAVSEQAGGPYTHLGVLLRGRGSGHWDEMMAHNPKLKRFGDKYYLYHISSQRGPSRGHIRDSQCIGVAVAETIKGPYQRFDAPILTPRPPIYNVAVNPGITRMTDGRYLLIVKGDIAPKKPEERMPQRIQALALANSPTGPFYLLDQPAILDTDTEDASIWYDARRETYYAVFHAHTYIGLIASENGFTWRQAKHYKVAEKRVAMKDGSVLLPDRMERPSVFIEEGEPRLLCLGSAKEEEWNCLLVPLRSDG